MILINLLPHREQARKKRREAFVVALALSALAGLLIAGLIYLWLQTRIIQQEGRNHVLQAEVQKLDAQIKDIATLQAEINALKSRQLAVEDLQADRNLPVHLLNELVSQLPQGVYLTSLKQDNQLITLQGQAQSNERVSELLRNLQGNSPWLSRPELIEIVAESLSINPREQRRVSRFTIRAGLVRPSDKNPAALAAPAGRPA